MNQKHYSFLSVITLGIVLAAALAGCGGGNAAPGNSGSAKVRLGYFANITHAQALIGLSRGDFKQALGENVELETKVFNAGPSVIEAFFAGELDLAYIGPSPALNGYIKSKGAAVRIVAGAAANGVSIIARKDAGIAGLKDLAGKRIATPQFGNTQDVSARHYVLRVLNSTLKDQGGVTEIQTVANADQINLFKQGELDAAWAPEPWGARLVHEAGGVVIAEEKELWEGKRFAAAVVLASRKFLEQQPELAAKFLKAHVGVTKWIVAHSDEAATIANTEIGKLIGKSLKPEVLKDAFARVEFTTDPLKESVIRFAEWSKELGFVKDALPPLEPLFDLKLLDKATAETGP